MKKALIFLVILVCNQSVSAQLEEVVVTAGRSDGAPVVLSVKADYHLQPIRLINDSLVESERERDLRLLYQALIKDIQGNTQMVVVRNQKNLAPIKDADDFNNWYFNSKSTNKSYLDLILKSEIKTHDASKGSYSKKYTEFLNNLGNGFGRSIVRFQGSSDITILNPRQYRSRLIKVIGKDIRELTDALGADYRVVVDGLDREIAWHREGEDNVEFFIPYSFIVLPKNITTLPSEY